MKDMNLFQYVSNASRSFEHYIEAIDKAEDFDKAQGYANKASGFVEAQCVVINTVMCVENNDFTASFGSIINGWMSEIYQQMVTAADKFDKPTEVVFKYCKKRNEYAEAAKD